MINYINTIILIYVIIIVFSIVFLIISNFRTKEIIKETILIQRELIELFIMLENEINKTQQLKIVGKMLMKYKIILGIISDTKSEKAVKRIIEDDLLFIFSQYFIQYTKNYNNEDRYEIISHFVYKWKGKKI